MIFIWPFSDANCSVKSDYLFVEELDAGDDGIQPFNFVLRNGESIKEKISSPLGLTQNLEDNLKWTNYNFSESKFENGSILAINIKKSTLKLILVNNFEKEEKNLKSKLEKIFLIPFWLGQMGQMINMTNFGKLKFDKNRPITVKLKLFCPKEKCNGLSEIDVPKIYF